MCFAIYCCVVYLLCAPVLVNHIYENYYDTYQTVLKANKYQPSVDPHKRGMDQLWAEDNVTPAIFFMFLPIILPLCMSAVIIFIVCGAFPVGIIFLWKLPRLVYRVRLLKIKLL